jgi:hypothetical protein
MQETYWLSDNLKQQIKNGTDSTGLNTGGEWVKYFSEHGALCPKKLLHETMGNREFYCFEHAASYNNEPNQFWQFTEQLPKPTTEQQAKPYGDGSYEVVKTWGNTEQPHLVLWYTNGQWGSPCATYFIAKEYVEQ